MPRWDADLPVEWLLNGTLGGRHSIAFPVYAVSQCLHGRVD